MTPFNRRVAILLARALGRLWHWEEWWVHTSIKCILYVMCWYCTIYLCNRYSADSVLDTWCKLRSLRFISWQLCACSHLCYIAILVAHDSFSFPSSCFLRAR